MSLIDDSFGVFRCDIVCTYFDWVLLMIFYFFLFVGIRTWYCSPICCENNLVWWVSLMHPILEIWYASKPWLGELADGDPDIVTQMPLVCSNKAIVMHFHCSSSFDALTCRLWHCEFKHGLYRAINVENAIFTRITSKIIFMTIMASLELEA